MCKQLGGKTLQHIGSHEAGLFKQDSHYSICFDTDTMLAFIFGENK